MKDDIEIRTSLPGDLEMLETLYREAFPDEDLLPLVRELLRDEAAVMSLVGMAGASLTGHIMLTRCGLSQGTDKIALLGPLAVAPARQRQGIGSALIQAGLEKQESVGITQVCVLGDPAYYGRFGFTAEKRVLPPYPLPEAWQAAWQSLSLGDVEATPEGKLSVPKPWRNPALWSN